MFRSFLINDLEQDELLSIFLVLPRYFLFMVFFQISVSVKLIFTTYPSSNAIPAQRVVTANSTTAFEILQLAAKTHPCYNFRYKTFSIGRYIESICCVEQNMTTHFYWFIYINDKLSPVGVDLLRPENGDTLTFKYEEWKSRHSHHSTQLPTATVFTATPTGKGQKMIALPVNAYILLIIAISWKLLLIN